MWEFCATASVESIHLSKNLHNSSIKTCHRWISKKDTTARKTLPQVPSCSTGKENAQQKNPPTHTLSFFPNYINGQRKHILSSSLKDCVS